MIVVDWRNHWIPGKRVQVPRRGRAGAGGPDCAARERRSRLGPLCSALG